MSKNSPDLTDLNVMIRVDLGALELNERSSRVSMASALVSFRISGANYIALFCFKVDQTTFGLKLLGLYEAPSKNILRVALAQGSNLGFLALIRFFPIKYIASDHSATAASWFLKKRDFFHPNSGLHEV